MTHGNPLILLVEDNEIIRSAFTVLLQESGYRVMGTGTGNEALDASSRQRPDLVLLDLGLPDMHGLEVIRRLKAGAAHDVPVVALTGRALATDEQACRAAGCVGYFSKPVDTQLLLRALPDYLAL